jgi:uncharacterized protein YkuJ
MPESVPTNSSLERQPTRKERTIALAVECIESKEVFPFPGIDPTVYAQMKAVEAEGLDRTSPIDERIKRFEREGMKVAFGKYPKSGNVFILPSQSTDIEMDGISPRQLQLSEDMNEKLKELVLLVKG